MNENDLTYVFGRKLKDVGDTVLPDSALPAVGNGIDTYSPAIKTHTDVSSVLSGFKKEGYLPFLISQVDSNRMASSWKLGLLVNPSDINFGSSQNVDTKFGRNSHIVTLWGASQLTITGNGSSAAFFDPDTGLADVFTRKTTKAYANLMSFVQAMRNNGYYALSTTKMVEVRRESSYQEGESSETGEEAAQKEKDSQGVSSTESIGNPLSSSKDGESYITPIVGGNNNRVIHVMDNMSVSYGGTSYLGSFASFSIEASGDSPYSLKYSFVFIVSGLDGDAVEGHINNGTNKDTGIIVGKQGTNFILSLGISKDFLGKATGMISYAMNTANTQLSGKYYLPTPTNYGALAIPSEWEAVVKSAAQANGILPSYVATIICNESGWNPKAKGPMVTGSTTSSNNGRHALGLGQFMPATAEEQHLAGAIANTTDDPSDTRDQRLDPVKAINAVARYLAHLIRGQGNVVELGVAAYNAGPGTVNKAVAKCGGDRENPNVISLLPRQETKDYVSRFLARQKGYSYLDSTGVLQE